jgi:hypothetical protein
MKGAKEHEEGNEGAARSAAIGLTWKVTMKSQPSPEELPVVRELRG